MKKNLGLKTALMSALMCVSMLSNAQLEKFTDGPAIQGFGKHTEAPSGNLNQNTLLKVAFDVARAAEAGKLNRQFDSLARFINMHVAAGVKPDNIELALVVHGGASADLLNDANYQKRYQLDNPNTPLINLLLANNVRVILCGQTAGARGISLPQLINGSEIELSAMTAHALLQQQGYTLNPF